MSGDDCDTDMGRELSCALCLDLYEDPLLLPCLHSLCRKCVTAMMQSQGGAVSEFRCPECQQTVSLGNEGISTLKRNFPMSNLVSVYRQTLKRGPVTSHSSSPCAPPSEEAERRCTGEAGGEETEEIPRGLLQPLLDPWEPVYENVPPKLPRKPSPPFTRENEPSDDVIILDPPSMSPAAPDQTTAREESVQSAASAPAPPLYFERICQPEVPTECSTCDGKPPSAATVHCSECFMSFCDRCRSLFHPPAGATATHYVYQLNSRDAESADCPLCEPNNVSRATTRCLQCGMKFCARCLRAFHPTEESTPGHTLVKIEPPCEPRDQQQQPSALPLAGLPAPFSAATTSPPATTATAVAAATSTSAGDLAISAGHLPPPPTTTTTTTTTTTMTTAMRPVSATTAASGVTSLPKLLPRPASTSAVTSVSIMPSAPPLHAVTATTATAAAAASTTTSGRRKILPDSLKNPSLDETEAKSGFFGGLRRVISEIASGVSPVLRPTARTLQITHPTTTSDASLVTSSDATTTSAASSVPMETACNQTSLLLGQRCSVCREAPHEWATSLCLDCRLYYCDKCVSTHLYLRHTLVDITVPDDVARQGQQRRGNLQLKLVELMDIQSQLMNELLEKLKERRRMLDDGYSS